jgi:hypothetical protein
MFNKLPCNARNVSDEKCSKVIYNWLVVNPMYNIKEFFEASFVANMFQTQ